MGKLKEPQIDKTTEEQETAEKTIDLDDDEALFEELALIPHPEDNHVTITLKSGAKVEFDSSYGQDFLANLFFMGGRRWFIFIEAREPRKTLVIRKKQIASYDVSSNKST